MKFLLNFLLFIWKFSDFFVLAPCTESYKEKEKYWFSFLFSRRERKNINYSSFMCLYFWAPSIELLCILRQNNSLKLELDRKMIINKLLSKWKIKIIERLIYSNGSVVSEIFRNKQINEHGRVGEGYTPP